MTSEMDQVLVGLFFSTAVGWFVQPYVWRLLKWIASMRVWWTDTHLHLGWHNGIEGKRALSHVCDQCEVLLDRGDSHLCRRCIGQKQHLAAYMWRSV